MSTKDIVEALQAVLNSDNCLEPLELDTIQQLYERMKGQLEEESRDKVVSLLVIPPQDKPVYFLVEHTDYKHWDISTKEGRESSKFYFEEHTCPTNWLAGTLEIYQGSPSIPDPHDLFKYIGTVPEQMITRDSYGAIDSESLKVFEEV